jgi:hypothetical protein
MLTHMSRSKVIQLWFAVTMLVGAAALAFGVQMTVGTGAMLLALCLVPPAIVLMMWPGAEPQTIAEVLHDAERGR